MLSALMAPFVGVRPPAPWKPLTTHFAEADAISPHDTHVQLADAHDPVLPEEPRYVRTAPNVQPRNVIAVACVPTRHLEAGQLAASQGRGDTAVMVVEDDPGPGRPSEPSRQPRQYAQLFARLRQG